MKAQAERILTGWPAYALGSLLLPLELAGLLGLACADWVPVDAARLPYGGTLHEVLGLSAFLGWLAGLLSGCGRDSRAYGRKVKAVLVALLALRFLPAASGPTATVLLLGLFVLTVCGGFMGGRRAGLMSTTFFDSGE